jgi:amino acid transporter
MEEAAAVQEVAETSRLKRGIGTVRATAVIFASVGASGGVFALWTFSYGSAGPAFFWAYPIIAAGVGIICLVWAELASHYPFAGTLYEWPRLLLGGGRNAERIAWWIGWLYLFGFIVSLIAIYVATANTVIQLAGWTPSNSLTTWVSLGFLALAIILNCLGIDRIGAASVIGVACELFVIVIIVTLVLILGAAQSPSVLTHTGGTSFGKWLPLFLGAAVFMPLWALFSFEGGGLLGEETKSASFKAPRAIFIAFGATVAVAMYEVLAFIFSTKHPVGAMTATSPITDNINRVLPTAFSKIYLAIIVEILFMSASAFFTFTVRQMFGMARAGELPASRFLTKTRSNGVPWASVVVVGVLSGVPLVISSKIAVLIGGATAEVYIAYFLMMAVFLYARLRGWPSQRAPFSLGRWGIPVAVLAVLVAGAYAANLEWPRDSTNPVWHAGVRAAYWMIGIPLLMGIAYRLWVRFRPTRVEAIDPVSAFASEQTAVEVPVRVTED